MGSESTVGPEQPTSRNIPLPIQRAVRQRCGFGCVVCGFPLYEYDHLLGWAIVQRHVAEEITLLCDQHHRDRTSGMLPFEQVRDANADPFNHREGVSKPYDLNFSGAECEVIIGSNRFTAQDAGYGTMMIPVMVDGDPLVGLILADGHLLLNLNVFDEFNNPVLRIVNNQLFHAASPWDIQFVGRNLIIREAARQFLIDITFEPPNRVVINRGRFLRNGVEILVRPTRAVVAGSGTFERCEFNNGLGGIVIGPTAEPVPAAVRIQNVSRYHSESATTADWVKEVLGEPPPLDEK